MNLERIKESVKKFFSNKKRNIVLIILVCLFVLDQLLTFMCNIFSSRLMDQNAAIRWDQEGKSEQISLFYTEDQIVTEDVIKKLEYTLENKMAEAGIIDIDENNNTSNIVDTVDISSGNKVTTEDVQDYKVLDSCYSAQGISTLIFESRKADNIETIGVGGEFFLFHPMELISGSYFDGDDVMKDLIVIDEMLAWQLFGSSDVVGQCVTIGGVNHYVSGVIRRSEGKLAKAAGLTNSVVIMSYDSLSKYGTILSGRTEEKETAEIGPKRQEGGINCYEVVMVSPVEGIGVNLIKQSSGLDDKYISVVDNTNRFKPLSLMNVISEFGIRSMWTKPVFYPYWENVARAYEDILGILMLLRIICIVCFWGIVAILIIIAYRNKTWTARGLIKYLADKKYDFDSKKQLKKLESKEKTDDTLL